MTELEDKFLVVIDIFQKDIDPIFGSITLFNYDRKSIDDSLGYSLWGEEGGDLFVLSASTAAYFSKHLGLTFDFDNFEYTIGLMQG